jgi:ribonuclease-3
MTHAHAGADDIIPYNIHNVLITKEDIYKLFMRFNLTVNVNDIKHYQMALTNKSYIKSEYALIDAVVLREAKPFGALELQDESNERLEFLGDTIIKCVVSEYLFRRYYEEDEGFLTRIKTKIEDKDSLARYAKRLGLDHFLIISKQMEENHGRNSHKFLEDCFEAFMGALYLDLGFDICKQFMNIILETEVDYADILYKDTNYKDQLLRFYHKNKWSHPVYVEIKAEGPIHKRVFTMGVKDFSGKIICECSDMNKRKAEQKCAMHALFKYNQITREQMILE